MVAGYEHVYQDCLRETAGDHSAVHEG
jgi:hypothetical protein